MGEARRLKTERTGRKRLEEPTIVHKRILELARNNMPAQQIASRFNISRQRVHYVLKRWGCDGPKRPKREPLPKIRKARKETIVSFRLTAKQVDMAVQRLGILGLSHGISASKACRAIVLLSINASGDFLLPNREVA